MKVGRRFGWPYCALQPGMKDEPVSPLSVPCQAEGQRGGGASWGNPRGCLREPAHVAQLVFSAGLPAYPPSYIGCNGLCLLDSAFAVTA